MIMATKKSNRIYSIIVICLVLILSSGCKKNDTNTENVPTDTTDFDGNVYHSVTIGTQTWMVENLKVTHFRNGDQIPNITDFTLWEQQSSPAYCWYNNNSTNKNPYGALYNWFTVSDSRVIAPIGWHIPTDDEWTTLITFLGGENLAGGPMKETGFTHWNQPNAGATNSSGFTAEPAGFRSGNDFVELNIGTDFWTSTESSAYLAWNRYLYYNKTQVDRGYNGFGVDKTDGKTIRCIKD